MNILSYSMFIIVYSFMLLEHFVFALHYPLLKLELLPTLPGWTRFSTPSRSLSSSIIFWKFSYKATKEVRTSVSYTIPLWQGSKSRTGNHSAFKQSEQVTKALSVITFFQWDKGHFAHFTSTYVPVFNQKLFLELTKLTVFRVSGEKSRWTKKSLRRGTSVATFTVVMPVLMSCSAYCPSQ